MHFKCGRHIFWGHPYIWRTTIRHDRITIVELHSLVPITMVTRLGFFRKFKESLSFLLSKIGMAMTVPPVPATGHTAGLYVGATRTG